MGIELFQSFYDLNLYAETMTMVFGFSFVGSCSGGVNIKRERVIVLQLLV